MLSTRGSRRVGKEERVIIASLSENKKEERERERDRERELHGQVHKKVTHALKEGLARARTHLGSFYISRESFAIFGK